MRGEPGDHRKAERLQVVGERVELGAVDARIHEDQPSVVRTTIELLQTHALCRTQTPSATSVSIVER